MDEKFCKNICQKYVSTMLKEMLLEKDNKILHIFIQDDYIELKQDGKINCQNYKNYLDEDFKEYEYDSYQELYNSFIKDEIIYDIKDLGLFDENDKWNFYITFEELKKIGVGFMIKDQFPLIEKYAISEEKIFEFFDYFSLEQIEDFENSLYLYYILNDIIYESNELVSKEDYLFNSDIIRLSEGLITYEDFIEDNKNKEPSKNDIILTKVIEYFKENQIKDLMDYGCDTDEGLNKLSSLYLEIMDKLNIKYLDVYTEDGISTGKYVTTIAFNNNFKIDIDTMAWEGIKRVTSNMESIYEYYEKSKTNEAQNDKDFEYDYN